MSKVYDSRVHTVSFNLRYKRASKFLTWVFALILFAHNIVNACLYKCNVYVHDCDSLVGTSSSPVQELLHSLLCHHTLIIIQYQVGKDILRQCTELTRTGKI